MAGWLLAPSVQSQRAVNVAGWLLAPSVQSQPAVNVAGGVAKVIAPFTGLVFPRGIGADAARNACVLETGSNLMVELPWLARYR